MSLRTGKTLEQSISGNAVPVVDLALALEIGRQGRDVVD